MSDAGLKRERSLQAFVQNPKQIALSLKETSNMRMSEEL